MRRCDSNSRCATTAGPASTTRGTWSSRCGRSAADRRSPCGRAAWGLRDQFGHVVARAEEADASDRIPQMVRRSPRERLGLGATPDAPHPAVEARGRAEQRLVVLAAVGARHHHDDPRCIRPGAVRHVMHAIADTGDRASGDAEPLATDDRVGLHQHDAPRQRCVPEGRARRPAVGSRGTSGIGENVEAADTFGDRRREDGKPDMPRWRW